ncbi:MAG TPA: MerR family transcriptional regulator [Pyrinomonadaceae bacterium]|nr:MerR family transcriptional regulator [Pyrinomonadaceae bacterium]
MPIKRRPGDAIDLLSHSLMTSVAIPEKLFFKIGEVCELAGVQAHVLRYWETEFPMLAPQKNRAGQRTYRRRDVEMALRIKELLYDEQYTIAGAKKKLANELRGGSIRETDSVTAAKPSMRSLKPPPSLAARFAATPAAAEPAPKATQVSGPNNQQKEAMRQVAKELREILDLLDETDREVKTKSARSRK